ncbi:hypothetical protein CDL15_Pgr006472 [Punica granatum]|uniref:UspA domain-containing protein n=1 Tax=Punica granatum TaxID=22663 RepID=A0A218Y028_PUNGR|nr:hypothetical protein CDL15_Pgr006472 [Punica granatum]
MHTSASFLRQLSGKEPPTKSTSKRWSVVGGSKRFSSSSTNNLPCGCDQSLTHMEGFTQCGLSSSPMVRKRVMVMVDDTPRSKHAMIWALTHVANKGDLLTLLHVIPPGTDSSSFSSSPYLVNSLGSLCKASKPEVEVEALVIQGPKLATVMSQVKKLEVSLLVLGQKKPSSLINCLCGTSGSDEFVEQCINGADCLTIGVRKQRRGMGGYLISTRWQKNFWLLA